ncbi:MaoC/PaaZ C-terminal domain-containing protein [Culturomica massiliensis]|uniref:MaoC/PaaZ C-terminal domain-containing protein n=1 Tax=Culturomica massiliensis TaxID=1841857 RepID=UPI0026703521|nr:MaoC/PaaZ C-terminal domain-containing protein [Culturomica massiliensis]
MMKAYFQEGQNYTQTFNLTESVYKAFQECSKDMNPLHTNKTFAREKGFQDRVMYGNILNAFISYFIGETLPTKEVIIHSQEINYKHPVYMNDTLYFQAVTEGIYESVKAVTFKFKFLNQQRIVVAKGKIQIGILL